MKAADLERVIRTGPYAGLTLAQRFQSQISTDNSRGCWEWTGKAFRNGYGCFYVAGKYCLAHRVAYALTFGEVDPSVVVCHRCDNPPCVNPDHLFAGSARDNVQDKCSKGRQFRAIGSKCGNAKLAEWQVMDMRRERDTGALYRDLALKYGISMKQVSKIITREQWAHVQESA
jgi:hypothetical protein